MSATARRLALGTVQFGMRYGVANGSGQVPLAEAAAILRTAKAAGMDTLDTAASYGESEERLGALGVDGWHLVSKLPPLPDDVPDVDGWVSALVRRSLDRLRVSQLDALLLHRPADLLGPRGLDLGRAVAACRERGLTRAVGVSIYAPSELDALWPRFPVQVVQAPLNVIDRRLADSGWLKRLRDEGVTVHARSAFLQGLLLMDEARRPAYFERWRPLWSAWSAWLAETSVPAATACLAFVLAQPGIDRVVVGVDSLAHLEELLAGVGDAMPLPTANLGCDDEDLLHPFRWPH